MGDLEVRIIRLEPQRVAATYGFGASPEPLAWDQMIAFVREKGLDQQGKTPRYFGFNNPNPAPGSPNYGYEQWVTVDAGVEGTQDAKIKEFSGGLFAVTRTTLRTIGEDWQKLVLWSEASQYRIANQQCLEEMLTPPGSPGEINEDMQLDLYLPVVG